MKVRAIQRGYYNHQIREPGDEFEMDLKFLKAAKLPSWVESAEKPELEPLPKPKKAKAPVEE